MSRGPIESRRRHVSPKAVADALVRTTVYSVFRAKTEMDILNSEDTQANLAQRLKDGFQSFALQFADQSKLGEMTAAHPFDSHPPLGERLEALGLKLTARVPGGRVRQTER